MSASRIPQKFDVGQSELVAIGVAGLLLLAAVGMVLGLVPVQTAYVVSDSMEPTLSENDIVFLYTAGDVEVGDVILYDRSGDENFILHRVVGETDDGYITQGDGNTITDQEQGHSPVSDSQVVGEVITVGGQPIHIPVLGAFPAAGIIGLALLSVVVALFGLVLSAGFRWYHDVDVPLHEVMPRLLAGGYALLLLVVYMTSASIRLSYFVTEDDVLNPRMLPHGEAVTREVLLPESVWTGLTYTIVESRGARVENIGGDAAGRWIVLSVPRQLQTGVHNVDLSVYTYPAVIPLEIVEQLHLIHPLAAIFTTVSVAYAPVVMTYVVAFKVGLLPPGAPEN